MNVVLGFLIGYLNSSWSSVLISSLGWGITYCLYQFTVGNNKKFIDSSAERKMKFSPALSFFFIAFMESFGTVLIIGTIVYYTKSFFL
ncbi:MAG: hypothetical protein H6Q66_589 [Firmicutes bacterium]|nr:hypothetical protein [Bacillota bacterium]